MKKIILSMVFVLGLMVSTTSLTAQTYYSVSLNGGTTYNSNPGSFAGFPWGTGIPNYTFNDTTSKNISIAITGYDESNPAVGNQLYINFSRSGFGNAPLNWGSDNFTNLRTLTPADFTGGAATIQVSIPVGTKPVADTDDYVAGYKYILQIVGANPSGNQTYINYVTSITEEITSGTSTATDITGFTLASQTGAATIDAGAHTVAIEVAHGTSLTSLSPTITLSSGATISPLTGTAQDFSGGAVNYTVTAQDGTTTQAWAVTVTEAAASTATDITSFVLADQAGSATIDAGAHTVAIEVTNGTSLTSLSPTIGLSTGATISPNTGVTQDFSGGAVNYTVTAQDGTTAQVWAVTVTEAAASSTIFELNIANTSEATTFVNGLPSNGFSATGTVTAAQWGGTFGAKMEKNASLIYNATSLTAGNYTMEAVIMVQNTGNTSWDMGSSPVTPANQTGTAATFFTYTESLTLTAGDHTFAITRGNDGFQFIVKEWKLTAAASSITSTGSGAWTGSIWGATAPTATSNVVIDHDITISTGITVNDLTVNGGGSLTISSGGSLIVNGTSTGNVTYTRNISTSGATKFDGWHLMSSPVSGQAYGTTWADANGIATGTGANRGIATYNNAVATGNWNYSDGSAATFAVGTGYSIKRTATGNVSFTGTINTDDITNVAVTTGSTGFNLVGNTFTAYMNSKTFLELTANTNLLDSETLWVWNPSTKNYDAKLSGDSTPFKVAPGQAFFVKASSGGNLTFAENTQSHETDTFLKSSAQEVTLTISDGSSVRFAKVRYNDNTTTGFDNGYDGETFSGVPNKLDVYTQLLANNKGKKYQIQALPKSDLESMVIPVGISSEESKEITFTTEALNIPSDYNMYLEDRTNKLLTRLDETNASYKANVDTGITEGRFFLHIRTSSVLATDSEILNSISIYKTSNNNLKITGLQKGKTTVSLFNILGKNVMTTSFVGANVNNVSLPKSLSTGIYIVKLQTETGKLNKKIILE